ncbi:MAG: hypothetical protein NXI27_12185 [Alphaproteobacteria bacterium]|nr:hypothetical protein [Alphaproteobacteria bacterium]
MDTLPWHIISYPRSGNHLARAIIEGYSHRPTIGCPESVLRDQPIYLRRPNLQSGAIKVFDHRPIGYKSHFAREFHAHDRALDGRAGLLLITRDPLEAISSHVYRIVSRRRFSLDKTIRRQVSSSIDSYLSLIHIYRSMAHRPRLHMRFETLADPKERVASAQILLRGIGVDAMVSPPDVEAIVSTARESQTSVGRMRVKLRDRIRHMVREHISYDDALKLIVNR